MPTRNLMRLLLAAAFFVAGGARAQVKWDLPAACTTTNFHSVHLVEFAHDVDKAGADGKQLVDA